MKNETILLIGLAIFIILFITWFISDAFKKAELIPTYRYEFYNSVNCYTYEAAKLYYSGEDLRGVKKLYMNIYDYETNTLVMRVRCSEYFKAGGHE